MNIRQSLLRARPDGEPDQVAQNATGLGSNILPFRHRQPGPPCAAHRRLLAHAHRPDAIPKMRDLAKAEFSTLRLRLIKVAARVIETASRVRLAFQRLPGSRSVLRPASRLDAARTLTAGAYAPFSHPHPSSASPENYVSRGEKPNGAAQLNSNNRKSSAGKPAFMNRVNYPVGEVTRARPNLWFKRRPNDNDLLPEDIEPFFTQICDSESRGSATDRVLLASQLIALFRVNRSWTEDSFSLVRLGTRSG